MLELGMLDIGSYDVVYDVPEVGDTYGPPPPPSSSGGFGFQGLLQGLFGLGQSALDARRARWERRAAEARAAAAAAGNRGSGTPSWLPMVAILGGAALLLKR